MAPLHSLLQRQVKRHFKALVACSKDLEGFLATVNEAYWQADDDRAMLERSLELSSQELLAANSEMRAVFQAFPDLYFRLDATGRILEVKSGTDTDLVLPASQLLGKCIQDVPQPGVRDRFDDAIARVRETKSSVGIEYSLDLAQDKRHFEARFVPLPEEQILVIVRDITKRKQAEEALRQSEDGFRVMFDDNPLPMWVYDLDSLRFLEVNEAAVRHYGYSREEFLRTKIIDIRPEGDVPRLLQDVSAGRPDLQFSSGWRHRLKSGEVINVDIASHTMELKGKKSVLVVALDVTERVCAERGLRQLAAIVESSYDAVIGKTLEGTVMSWNLAAQRIYGYSAEEMEGKSISILVPPDRAGELTRMWETLRRGERVKNLETQRLRKDGKLVDVALSISPIKDQAGTVVGASTIARDISERKRAEEALRQSEEKFQQSQKMEAVGRLAGGVAHDFNNLLTVISGHCELLVQQSKTGDPSPGSIDEIQKAAERASQLTRQLLAFSRKQILQPKVLDLNDVVNGMEKMARRLIGEDVELRTVLKKPLGRITADPGQVEQVIMNLAVNARDAMPRGGRLLIETDNVMLDEKSCHGNRCLEPGEYVMLAITDTGIGMTDSVKSHLFEPFFTTKGQGKGTGLGLATCYGIVKQSGGDIRVYSEPDHGTTFRIYFPQTSQSAAIEARPAVNAAPCKGTETLLLIEDEVSVRRLTATVLRRCGYIVHEANDGVEAMQLINSDHGPRFDLIVSDMIMPRMGGKELMENVRLKYPDIKVLFISGYTDDALGDRGVLGPGIAFLEKPFSPQRFTQRVREVLDEPSALVADAAR